MNYPCKNPYVKCYKIEDKPNRILMIDELTGLACDSSIRLADIFLQLDGETDPYSLIEEERHEYLRESLRELDKNGMLKKRIYRVDYFEWLVPVLWLKDKKFHLSMFKFADKLIRLIAFPTLVISIFTLKDALISSHQPYSDYQLIWGTVIGYLAGLVLHELSHFISAIAAETDVIEMGLILGVIPGAYVYYDDQKISTRRKRIYTYAAGILMNFLFAGICFLLSRFAFFTFFVITGIVNVTLGATNMICTISLDGMHILRELFGKKFDRLSKSHNLFEKQELIRIKKLNGCALLLAQILFRVLKVSVYILMVSNVICVISLFLE